MRQTQFLPLFVLGAILSAETLAQEPADAVHEYCERALPAGGFFMDGRDLVTDTVNAYLRQVELQQGDIDFICDIPGDSARLQYAHGTLHGRGGNVGFRGPVHVSGTILRQQTAGITDQQPECWLLLIDGSSAVVQLDALPRALLSEGQRVELLLAESLPFRNCGRHRFAVSEARALDEELEPSDALRVFESDVRRAVSSLDVEYPELAVSIHTTFVRVSGLGRNDRRPLEAALVGRHGMISETEFGFSIWPLAPNTGTEFP